MKWGYRRNYFSILKIPSTNHIFDRSEEPFKLSVFLAFYPVLLCEIMLERELLNLGGGLDYIDLPRKLQNMSSFDLLEPTYRYLPTFPRPEMSMALIQTQKFIHCQPHPSQQFDLPSDPELSLEQHLQQNNITSTSTIKKKKGGCTCKKTKCLKMYCECFASGKMCTEQCNCKNCQNCQQHKDSIKEAQEIVKVKQATKQSGLKGCNCRKTHCQKKYCECFNAGISCTKECKCIDCQNLQSSQKSGQTQSKESILIRVAQSFIA